jgi:predicted P-loop ATPase
MLTLSDIKALTKSPKDTADGGFDCICPCHNDTHPSCHIKNGNKGIIARCKACGATGKDIFPKLGISLNEVFYEKQAVTEKREYWQIWLERARGKKIEAVYNYQFYDGSYAFTKVKFVKDANGKKKCDYGFVQDGKYKSGLYWQDGSKGRDGKRAVFGNVPSIRKAIEQGKTIYITEGEKDTETCIKHGLTAFTYGGANEWQSIFSEVVEGADVVVLRDNDEPGEEVANRIKGDILPIVKSLKIVNPIPEIEKADISDYFQRHTDGEFRQMIEQAENLKGAADSQTTALVDSNINTLQKQENGVISLLVTRPTAKGEMKVQQLVKNWEIVLENDSRFSGKVRFDEFSRQLYLWGATPWESKEPFRPWQNSDDAQLYALIQNDYELTKRDDYFDSISNISQRHKFHQVRDVLESIPFSGEGHIRRLLPDYLGAGDTEYNFQVMRLMMLGGVARVYNAGAKFDYCTILEGRQGLGKSTFLRLLALDDSFFNDSLDSLDSTTAVQGLLGSWVIELAELKSLGRTSGGIESVKRFLSATSDKIRLPYQRRSEIFPRQCIFFGTTNSTSYLDDATGNRRFLIVRCGENEPTKSLFSQEAVEDFRKAWAEAVHIYKTDKPKLVLSAEAAAEAAELAESARIDDGKTGIIADFLENRTRTCVLEVWKEALQEERRPKKFESTEIANIIMGLGWERVHNPTNFGEYGKQRLFQKSYKLKEQIAEGTLQEDDEPTPFT